MNGICCELGARTGPSLGAEGPQVGMFTVLSADGGAILEEGKTFAHRACIPSPQETIPPNALRPGVQRPPVKRTQKGNGLVLLRCLCLLPMTSRSLPMGFCSFSCSFQGIDGEQGEGTTGSATWVSTVSPGPKC